MTERPTWGTVVGAIAIVAGLGLGADRADARPRRKAGATLAATDLGWPATTRSATARTTTRAFTKAGGTGLKLGKVAKGTRVGWRRIVASRDRCRAWLEIDPRGWVCAADLAPSDDAPAATLEVAWILAQTLQQELYGVVPDGARAYRSVGAIARRHADRTLKGWTLIRGRGATVAVAGRTYAKTDRGLIAAERLTPRPPSPFVGRDLIAAPPPAWPFAWVSPARKDALTPVRAAPRADAAEVRSLPRREIVAVLESQGGFARIADGEWIALAQLRVARKTSRPRGVAAGERWIDVDLDEQVLVAYDHDEPVYATLISSGRGRSTPTGIHRISKKVARARMKAPKVSRGSWDLPDVPFAMHFRKYYSMHGAYWHDGFGAPRSQGCVNLSPHDARFVFEWSHPHVPAGWLDARDPRGTPVRIRDHRDREPGWIEYDTPPPPTVKLRRSAGSEPD